ncbi:MAG: bifunctional demethylmenaquinone methyltransferase/2-methoxy-6-polyprenyl-1,4-benzoquinol methylase UbiE [Saprospiraceae bacterium]|nr:bifunctional demethylmenaquinone methyltransferase/2-methoxy-6-polyprenyl-1,4-benzoquinol methylase UbiE [Saprospiraceae bacterium]
MSESVKPYNQSESKKNQVSAMFNRIAPYYDLLNAVLSLGIDTIWRRKAIQQLNKNQPKIILDVATGTADLAIETAKQLNPEKIVGVDISTQMLDIGRTKLKKKSLDQLITLEEGDSENLPFEDNTFDAITVAFGVRNFEHLEKGLKEMHRVLKPNGQLVVLEFSRPSIFPIKQLFNLYFKYILPRIGNLTSKDSRAYSYLYESVQAFPDGKDFVNILSKTGYKSNQCKALTLGICSIYSGFKH